MPASTRSEARPRLRVRRDQGVPTAAPQPALIGWRLKREHWPVILIAVAALGLRLHGLGRRHIVFDESVILDPEILRLGVMTYAQKLWTETTYNPGWPMLIWLIQRITGISTFWARLPSAVCGALTPVVFYALAREMGLRRATALFAGAVLSIAIFQVEYGQQIMPHAALPLGCCFCLWLVTRLSNLGDQLAPWRLLSLYAGLFTVFGVMMLLHNSTLLLIPLLLGYLGWSAWRPMATAPHPTGTDARRFALVGWALCIVAFGFVSLGWFIAKAGHSDWWHLRPFFMSTFRNAPERAIVSDRLELLDSWYLDGFTDLKGKAGVVRDSVYFVVSRLFDFVYGQFRLTGEQQFAGGSWQWLMPLVMVLLVARGAIQALRHRATPPASRWVFVSGLMLALIVMCSALRLFPFGGIRHLIVLSPLVILFAAVGLESSSRGLSRMLAALCLTWTTADIASLPHYYRITRNYVSHQRFQDAVRRFGVHDFVAADTICSEGSLRLEALACSDVRMVPADDPAFARLTLEHKPFFVCALHDPIFDSALEDRPPVASTRFKELAHPLANLRHYRAVPIARPLYPYYWLAWTIYYMEPQAGASPPEVADIAQCKQVGSNVPWAFVVRFSRPIRPETLNRDSIQLVASGRPNSPLIPIDLHYAEATRTLTVTPLKPLDDVPHVLALYRTIRDVEGRPLDANGDAFYQYFPNGPDMGSGRVDRGWMIRAQSTPRSSKL